MRTPVRELNGEPRAQSVTVRGGREIPLPDSLGKINMDDLRGETERAGGFTVFLAVLVGEAWEDRERAELAVVRFQSEQGKVLRKLARDEEVKPVTERWLEEQLMKLPEYVALRERVIEAGARLKTLEGVLRSSESKQRALSMSLASMLFRELHAEGGGMTSSRTMQQQIRDAVRRDRDSTPH